MKYLILTLLPALLLICLTLIFAPDGNIKNDWFRFLGGFHPLIVHFPIALVLFIPVLEIAGFFKADLNTRPVVDILIKVALLASIAAPLLGWSLAWGDGFSGDMVTAHMWAGVLVPLSCGVMLLAHKSNQMFMYFIMMVVSVLLVSWTGFLGGQLAHGKTHLTAHMPDSLRNVLGVEKPIMIALDDPSTFFGGRIAPVLAARCVICHGPDKTKGKLRLDSFAMLNAGGANGAVVTAGSSTTSELHRRITLPTFHDDFMPAEGNPAMSAEEIELIALWIDQGATLDIAADAVADAPMIDMSGLPIEVIVPDFDPAGAEIDRAELASAVAEIQTQFPYILNYVSRNTADLDFNATMMRDKFTDTDFALFKPVLSRITRADFTATSITDASAALLLGMTKIDNLRLNETSLSDQTIAKLTSLKTLKSLNIRNVNVSAETKSGLANIENLYMN